MKILFFARHYSYLRLFESSISELARRGHQLHLSADREEAIGGRRMVEALAQQYPNITLGTTPGRAPGAWSEFAGACAWASTTCGTSIRATTTRLT